jgi:transcriptional regulator with XRE-family HTH domain
VTTATTKRRKQRPPYQILGLKVRRAREQTGLSQENFAPRVGTTRRHLIRIEGGHHKPGGALLDRIATETGTPRESFTNEDDEEEAALSFDEFLRRRVRQIMREEAEA